MKNTKDLGDTVKKLDKRVTHIENQLKSLKTDSKSYLWVALLVLTLALALPFVDVQTHSTQLHNFITTFTNNLTQHDKFTAKVNKREEFIFKHQCKSLSIYYNSTQVQYDGEKNGCIVNVRTILEFANRAFDPRHPLTRLLTETGRDLRCNWVDFAITEESISDTLMLVALADHEKFIWPAEQLNKTKWILLGTDTDHPQRVGVNPLAKEPRLLELLNLLTKEETEHFYNLAKALEKVESLVGPDNANTVKSKSRSSSHTWIGIGGLHPSDEIIDRVEKRIFELTRLDETTTEPFQIVFYNKTQYYYGHHDYTEPQFAPHNPYYVGDGNRLVTVLLYLNEVEEGGETAFPFVAEDGSPINREREPASMYEGSLACDSGGLKVKPKKGGAAMFYSLTEDGHMDGKVDKWTVHAGCPVIRGEKYISNKWVRNKRVDGKLYDANW